MPSGHDKADDYSGERPGWGGGRSLLAFVAFVALVVVLAYRFS